MKKSLVIALLTIIVTFAASQKMNAQNIKVITGHPDFKIEVLRCAASGPNVVLDLMVTNIGYEDVKEFKVHGSNYATKFYDNLGNIYERDQSVEVKIANKDYTVSDCTIKLVAGLPTRLSYIVHNVSPRATSFVLIEPDIWVPDWSINLETVKIRFVPIAR